MWKRTPKYIAFAIRCPRDGWSSVRKERIVRVDNGSTIPAWTSKGSLGKSGSAHFAGSVVGRGTEVHYRSIHNLHTD